MVSPKFFRESGINGRVKTVYLNAHATPNTFENVNILVYRFHLVFRFEFTQKISATSTHQVGAFRSV